ncbi:MAG TPA: MBL fold metallo-hydrolase [Pyrinomonadaceae bacterium]
MIIEQITLTAFQQHTRVLGCERTRRAVCVDPGEATDEIVEFLDETGLELQAIALTHAHMDHVGGVAALKRARPHAEVVLHEADEPLYFALPRQPELLGIPRAQWRHFGFEYEAPPPVERHWRDGEVYKVGELEFKVLHCPGHTPGHVVLFEPRERKVFVGDCLFAGSVGRTDLPGGSAQQLLDSIHHKILTLGDDVTVYSGHGPETTIAHERRTNPFLTGRYL